MIGVTGSYGAHVAAAILWALCGCAQSASYSARSPAATAENSILARSSPAAGSTVSAPVNELVLNFNPPARLGEVTVTGPDGVMPTMVTSVGEVQRYSVPLSGLGWGDYVVRWSATVGEQPHEGSFSFSVR